jgi:hypothetical protein
MKYLRYIRQHVKTTLFCGWMIYLGYALASGKIEPQAAWERLTSAEVMTLILGAW